MSDQDEIVAVDTNTEGEEATESNEYSVEDTVNLEEELENERQAKAQILARAKKAEAELKELKKAQAPHINNNSELTEEIKLIARGLSDEEIEQAKVVAKGKGIALTEAIKDNLFLTYQSDLKEKKRKEDAKLGASKGSGESQDDSGLTYEMSREDHQKAFNKIMR